VSVTSVAGHLETDADPGSAAFWEGVRERKLLIHRCGSCGRTAAPFGPACVFCGSEDLELVESAGIGTVYTWTVCHRAMDPIFVDDVPYTVCAVRLDEGAILYGRLIDAREGEVRADLPVGVAWVEAAPADGLLWAFRPRRGEAA
jgi:uncharacterized OB-fold protein